tara:strand:+ start:550 stop:819 length:270 start_codon:yes stop_codon:yes gene_type:complete
MIYKIYRKYDFEKNHNVNLEYIYNFSQEVARGYYVENMFHNSCHITDSLQAMHYLLTIGGLKTHITNIDIFSVFVANMLHDLEHPCYTN